MKRLLLLIVFSCTAVAAEPVVRYGHTFGSSMMPTFNGAQAIKETYVPFGDVRKGDIVVYWDWLRQIRVCHRVVRRLRNNAWLAKGDNPNTNPAPDDMPVTKFNYLFVAVPCDEFAKP